MLQRYQRQLKSECAEVLAMKSETIIEFWHDKWIGVCWCQFTVWHHDDDFDCILIISHCSNDFCRLNKFMPKSRSKRNAFEMEEKEMIYIKKSNKYQHEIEMERRTKKQKKVATIAVQIVISSLVLLLCWLLIDSMNEWLDPFR